jgi:hypothetical protein
LDGIRIQSDLFGGTIDDSAYTAAFAPGLGREHSSQRVNRSYVFRQEQVRIFLSPFALEIFRGGSTECHHDETAVSWDLTCFHLVQDAVDDARTLSTAGYANKHTIGIRLIDELALLSVHGCTQFQYTPHA